MHPIEQADEFIGHGRNRAEAAQQRAPDTFMRGGHRDRQRPPRGVPWRGWSWLP